MTRRTLSMAIVVVRLVAPTCAMAGAQTTSESGDDAAGQGGELTWGDLVENGDDPVDARFIGAIGGAALGAEAIMCIEGAVGVDKIWPYVTLPWIGALGGGVGGYFLERRSPGGAVALLISSIALVIPTAILVKSAMAFDPEEEGAVGADLEDDRRYSFEEPPKGGAAPREETSTEVEARPEGPPEPAPGPTSERPRPSDTSTARQRQPSRKPSEDLGRRATPAGTLVHVGQDGSARLALPAVGIWPAAPSGSVGRVSSRPGLVMFVPLLRVDFP